MSSPESVSSQHGYLGFEQGQLQDLVALALTAGEAFVEVPVHERLVHAEPGHPRAHRHVDLDGRDVFAAPRRDGLPQEVAHRDAGDVLGILECQEQPSFGTGVGIPFGDVVASEADLAAGDLVFGRSQDCGGKRGLA